MPRAFIGSNLSIHLLRRGEKVRALDDLSTGTRANIDRVAAVGGDHFAFVHGSVLDENAVRKALRGATTLVHLAAQVSVQQSFEDPAHTSDVNVTGFLRLYRAAAGAGVARFIYASSCAAYGDNPELPLGEDASPRPLSPYAISKLVNEQLAELLRSRYPTMEVVGLRFFNIYGPRQDHRGGYAAVIPRWIDCCLSGERPVIFGDGSAKRDFCYVGDLAATIEHVGRRDRTGTHRIYNVGTGVSTSLNSLYDTITQALAVRGVSPPAQGPEYRPWRNGDIMHSCGDNGRLRRDLVIAAPTHLRTGIGRILEDQYQL